MQNHGNNWCIPAQILLCLISTSTRSFGATSRPVLSLTMLGSRNMSFIRCESLFNKRIEHKMCLPVGSIKPGRITSNKPRNFLLFKRQHWLVRIPVKYHEKECAVVHWEESWCWLSFMLENLFVIESSRTWQGSQNRRKIIGADAWAWERLSPVSRVPWYPDFEDLKICANSALMPLQVCGFLENLMPRRILGWDAGAHREHPRGRRDTVSKIFVQRSLWGRLQPRRQSTAFACEPAGKATLEDQTLFSRLPMFQRMPNLQKLPFCVLQTALNADTVIAAGESIWQGLEKIRPNLQTPLFSPALRICAETKILKHQHDCHNLSGVICTIPARRAAPILQAMADCCLG